jgi:hypothetical protein
LQARVIAGDPHAANVAYAGTDHGVFRFEPTAAGGPAPWQPYNKGLPLTTVVSLLVAPDKTLRAGTKGRGAWEVLTGP